MFPTVQLLSVIPRSYTCSAFLQQPPTISPFLRCLDRRRGVPLLTASTFPSDHSSLERHRKSQSPVYLPEQRESPVVIPKRDVQLTCGRQISACRERHDRRTHTYQASTSILGLKGAWASIIACDGLANDQIFEAAVVLSLP
jgi:hypothetical protein